MDLKINSSTVSSPFIEKEKAYNSLKIKLTGQIADKEKSFNIISVFSDNISFGGFWDKFAVINFSPRFSISPFKSINLSGNYNLSCLVPMGSIRNYSKSVVIQGVLMLAVDNLFKLTSESPGWIIELISYAAKNFLINSFIRKVIRHSGDSSDPMYEYEYYNYNVRINF